MGSVTLLAQKKSCMCWVWNIGSFWEVSVLTDGPRKPKENASAADAVLTILTKSMAMNIAAPAITRIARRLSEIGVPIFCTFLFGAEEERCHTPAPACYSILSMNQLGNQCIPLTSDLFEPACEQHPSAKKHTPEQSRYRGRQKGSRRPSVEEQAKNQGCQVDKRRRCEDPCLVLLVAGHMLSPSSAGLPRLANFRA